MFIYGVVAFGLLLTVAGIVKLTNMNSYSYCKGKSGWGSALTLPSILILFGLYIFLMATGTELLLRIYIKIFLGVVGTLLIIDSVASIRDNYKLTMCNKERRFYVFIITTAINCIGLIGGILLIGLLLLSFYNS